MADLKEDVDRDLGNGLSRSKLAYVVVVIPGGYGQELFH
jgi:hypothetical protein